MGLLKQHLAANRQLFDPRLQQHLFFTFHMGEQQWGVSFFFLTHFLYPLQGVSMFNFALRDKCKQIRRPNYLWAWPAALAQHQKLAWPAAALIVPKEEHCSTALCLSLFLSHSRSGALEPRRGFVQTNRKSQPQSSRKRVHCGNRGKWSVGRKRERKRELELGPDYLKIRLTCPPFVETAR